MTATRAPAVTFAVIALSCAPPPKPAAPSPPPALPAAAAPDAPSAPVASCDGACAHHYECAARNELPIYRSCLASCEDDAAPGLLELQTAECGALPALLAATDAPIRPRTCRELTAAVQTRPPDRALHTLLRSRTWCAADPGATVEDAFPSTAQVQFGDDAVVTIGGDSRCWMLDGTELAVASDGATWIRGEATTGSGPRKIQWIRAPLWLLAACAPEPPDEPRRSAR